MGYHVAQMLYLFIYDRDFFSVVMDLLTISSIGTAYSQSMATYLYLAVQILTLATVSYAVGLRPNHFRVTTTTIYPLTRCRRPI